MSNLHLVTLRKNLNVSPKVIAEAIFDIYGKAAVKKFDINIKGILTLNEFTLLLDERGVERLLKIVSKHNGNSMTVPLTVHDSSPFLGDEDCIVLVNNLKIFVHTCGYNLIVGHYGKESTEIYAGNVLYALDDCVTECVEALGVRNNSNYVHIHQVSMVEGDYITREMLEAESERRVINTGFSIEEDDY